MQNATDDVVKAIGNIGGTIGKLNQISTVIAVAVEEQGAATQEIARNVDQAAVGTAEVSRNIRGVDLASRQNSLASRHVLDSAAQVGQQSGHLGDEVEGFLAKMRAV